MVTVNIENVVVTATIPCRLDLNRIKSSVPGVTVPPKFPAVVYRPPPQQSVKATSGKRSKPCILVFSSGKLVCPGNRNTRTAKVLIRRFIEELRERDIEVSGKQAYEVSNIVASGDLEGYINLEGAAERLRGVVFEPGVFPGLIYRIDEPKAVFLLYANGKFVCPGNKDEKTIRPAIMKVMQQLKEMGLIAERARKPEATPTS